MHLMKKHFPIILMVFVFIVVLSSCGRVKDPEFRRLDQFGIRSMDFQQATIGFSATYINPNNFGVRVKEAVLDFYVDSIYVGKFVQPNLIEVNPGTEFSIPMEGKVSWRDAVNSNLKKLAGKEVLVKANGAVKVGKAGVFITKDINYQGKHTLDLNLLKNPAAAGL